VVIEGETGLFIEPGDADALASKIQYLLEEPQLRTRLRLQARERICHRFSLSDYINKLNSFYSDIL
jgi:glycosyltransferase involved in cell wall biosynthesis